MRLTLVVPHKRCPETAARGACTSALPGERALLAAGRPPAPGGGCGRQYRALHTMLARARHRVVRGHSRGAGLPLKKCIRNHKAPSPAAAGLGLGVQRCPLSQPGTLARACSCSRIATRRALTFRLFAAPVACVGHVQARPQGHQRCQPRDHPQVQERECRTTPRSRPAAL